MKTRLTILVSLLLCVGHGNAQADGDPLPDVGPVPKNTYKMPADAKAADELRKALAASNEDVNALLVALQKSGCNEDAVKALCAKHPDLPACKQQTVTPTPTPKRPPSRPRPKTPKKVDPAPSKDKGGGNAYLDLERFSDGGKDNCLRLTPWTDKDHDGKKDADEVTGKTETVCNGKDGVSSHIELERFTKDKKYPNACVRITSWLDVNRNGKMDKAEAKSETVCDGKDGKDGQDGSAGRPGVDGASNTRVQFGLGLRSSGIWSKDRPIGYSAAPEAQLELWLAPTVEFVTGVAWAPDGDRNMVVTGQLRRRGIHSRLGFGLGVQYQAWNLVGNKALWQSVMGLASAQLVLVDSKYMVVSLDAGIMVGLDGYDAQAQFGAGATGGITFSFKQ